MIKSFFTITRPTSSNDFFFFSSRRRHTRFKCDWSSDVCSSDLPQTLQVNSGNVIRLRVPTQLERAGDFSQTRDQNGNLLTSIYDASTGAPFPNLKIPAQRLYAPALAVLNRYPLPTLTQQAGTNYNYEAPAGSYNQLTQQPAVRLDYQVSEKLRLTGKVSRQRQRPATQPGLLPRFSHAYVPYPYITHYTATIDYTISPT